MLIANFTHPLTAHQTAAIEQLTGQRVERVIEVKTQLDSTLPFVEQAHALVNAVGLTDAEWQTLSLLINLPSSLSENPLCLTARLVVDLEHGKNI